VYPVAAQGPVATAVDRTCVRGIHTNTFDMIERHLVIVPVEQNGAVRSIMKMVIRYYLSYSFQPDGGTVCLHQARKIMDTAVRHEMLRRGQCLPVTAGKPDSRLTDIVDA
jgi:hypothetical protein